MRTAGARDKGRRQSWPKRLTREILAPLHRRWLAGEAIHALALEEHTQNRRLVAAFLAHGFDMTALSRPKNTSDRIAKHIFTEAWKPNRSFDASSHRAARHYKGSFDL